MNTGQLLVADHSIITGREYCAAYTDSFGRWNPGFYCPQSESRAAISCCGTSTYKYCCDATTSNGNGYGYGNYGNGHGTDGHEYGPNSSPAAGIGAGATGSAADGAENLNAPFLVRFPILSGVVTGFLLVTIFVVIGSCYSHSCCIFSKRSYLSSGLLYQIVVRKSNAARAGANAAAHAATGSRGGRRRTRPIQSVVVCTAESYVPAMPFGHEQLQLEQYCTDKNIGCANEPCGKLITTPVITQNSNFPISGGQSPVNVNIINAQQQQHQSSTTTATGHTHNFQNITQALENSVGPLPAQATGRAASAIGVQLSRTNNNDSPQAVNVNMTGVASARNITGPELLLHCPSETPRSRPSSQNSMSKYNTYAYPGRNSYSYSTLPILRGNRSSSVHHNEPAAVNYYSTYEIASANPQPPNYGEVYEAGAAQVQDCYGYGPANVQRGGYATLNFTRPRSNPSPSQMYNSGSGAGSTGSGSKHKSILKKPGYSHTQAQWRDSRPASISMSSPSPRYYISSSSHSAPEDEDEEPDYYYMKQQVSTTPPDIIQTRHSYAGLADRRDSPLMQMQQPQQQMVVNYVTPHQHPHQNRSVQVQIEDKPPRVLELEDQQSEMSEIEIDTFL